MRAHIVRSIPPAALLVAALCGAAAAAPLDPAPLYEVIELRSLGGTESAANSVNNLGLLSGFSDLPGGERRHAMLWFYGLKRDLGTLGGPNSSVIWPVKNDWGRIVGIAETDDLDPLGEAWSCSAFFPGEPTGHVCRGFVWEWGSMRALPTLGGTHGFAAGANNRGQVVGWAENTVEDPTCNPPQVLQFRAVVWGPGHRTEELPPLAGDTVSAATAINDRGQVAGISGICDNAVGRFSAAHAVLWEDGAVIDLGSLGGVSWNTPTAINERGHVVGFSNPPGDEDGGFQARAFLWTEEGGIQDLGTLPGHTTSQAWGINERDQVVGLSCGADGCSGFLWQDGVMTDLNDRAPGYDAHLFYANDINDLGVIAGQAFDAASGESKAFWALPVHGHRGAAGAVASPAEPSGRAPAPVVPDGVREQLLRQLGLGGAGLGR